MNRKEIKKILPVIISKYNKTNEKVHWNKTR